MGNEEQCFLVFETFEVQKVIKLSQSNELKEIYRVCWIRVLKNEKEGYNGFINRFSGIENWL